MGQQQSTLEKTGYKIEAQTKNGVIATKDGKKFLIRMLRLQNQTRILGPLFLYATKRLLKKNANTIKRRREHRIDFYVGSVVSLFTTTTDTSPWSVGVIDADFLPDQSNKVFFQQNSTNKEIISEIEKLKDTRHPHIINTSNSFQDDDRETYYVVMDYCEGGSLAEKIRGSRESLQEFEILSWINEICMGLEFLHGKGLRHKHLNTENIFFTEWGTLCLGGFGKIEENSNNNKQAIYYLAPEVLRDGRYTAESEMWWLGCILFELCTQQKVTFSGHCRSLPDDCSQEICELLRDLWHRDPDLRLKTSKLLGRPSMAECLSKKIKTTVDQLQTQLDKLKEVADNLEAVHKGTTIGSLTGGVIGAAGGITTIVGLILIPFTFGASVIVSGVGLGVGLTGALTASTSNITNAFSQSIKKKAIQSINQEFDEKINAIAVWLQQIGNSLQQINSTSQSGDALNDEGTTSKEDAFIKFGTRVGRCVGNITAEGISLIRAATIGEIAAQASKALRVTQVATGVLSGIFLAADVFFIAMDAKELQKMNQKDKDGKICSEIMQFAQSTRQGADELQILLDELKKIMSTFPSLEEMEEWEWEDTTLDLLSESEELLPSE